MMPEILVIEEFLKRLAHTLALKNSPAKQYTKTSNIIAM